ncbi:hypothetical protein ACNQ1H_26895, partial [Enterobacter cloacae complex sp.6722787]|uniref:hypothetical protein n=1 Tax=Enterobacter cloacae complex sp.6722787 TaxID=3397174 RepID=UPI003AAE4793
MQTIAIRRYDNYCPSTQSTQPLVDQMVRKSCGSFFLIEGPERPGELEVEKPYSCLLYTSPSPRDIEKDLGGGGG